MDSSFKIVIVDENPIRAAILEDGLREAGHVQVVRIDEMAQSARPHLRDRSRRHPDRPGKPEPRRAGADVPGQPRREAADRHVRRPERHRLDRGRGRCRRLGLHRRRSAARSACKNILDLCISRFNAFSRLQDELDRTKLALEERKVIDRAKGILMKAKNLTEEDGLRPAAQDRDEREQEDRRSRAIGDHRRGAVQMSDTASRHSCASASFRSATRPR